MTEPIESKTVAQLAQEGGWCEKLVEDVANYYKALIKQIEPYLEDLKYFTEQEGGSYYSIEQGQIIREEDVDIVINRLKSESYGAK